MLIPGNGTQLWVEESRPDGEPVIFLHFSSGHSGMFEPVLAHFPSHYRLITMDVRGHGRSAAPATGYSIGEMAGDVIAVMDHLGVGTARIVGSSLGAEIALRMAAEFPERVVSVVLEQAFQNTFGPHGVHDIPEEDVPAKLAELMAARAARPPLVADTLEAAVQLVTERWGRSGGAFARAAAGIVGPQPGGGFGLIFPPHAQMAYMQDFWLTRFERDFARVRCPVLFLPDEASMQDSQVQASMAWFRGLLPGSSVTVIPGADHAFVWLDRPAEAAQAVLDFFAREGAA